MMEQLDAISKKLDVVIKLMATNQIQNKSFDEKIIFLDSLGFDNGYIAEMIGAQSNTVKTRKSQLKTKKIGK